MKKILSILILFVFVAISITACSQKKSPTASSISTNVVSIDENSSPSNSNGETSSGAVDVLNYTDKAAGFTLSYPKTWTLSSYNAIPTFFSAAFPNVSVSVKNEKSQTPIKEYSEMYINEFSSINKNLTLLDTEDYVLNGNPAKRIECTSTVGIVDMQYLIIITTKNNTAYVLSCTTSKDNYDAVIKDFSIFAESLKIS